MTRHAIKHAHCLPPPSQTRCWHCCAAMLLFQVIGTALRHLHLTAQMPAPPGNPRLHALPAAGECQEQNNMKFGCVLLNLGAAVPALFCSTLGLGSWVAAAWPTGCLQQRGTLELQRALSLLTHLLPCLLPPSVAFASLSNQLSACQHSGAH